MKYKKVINGTFLSRPNRFIANVKIGEYIETVHVKNTGRCNELLVNGATVYLSVEDNPLRKTKYDLIAVLKEKPNGALLINMDSQIVNDVAHEWLSLGTIFSKNANIRREVTYGSSRFDFYIEDGDRKAFLEVKGVTLEHDDVAMFPDAPTLRGVKHLKELCQCLREGYEAYILFIIQLKGVSHFKPNSELHYEFSNSLKEAVSLGVNLLCVDCNVTPDSISVNDYITAIL